MYPPSLEQIADNSRTCRHCGKSGRMSYFKSEKAAIVCGVPLSASPAMWHCNYCGANTEVTQ